MRQPKRASLTLGKDLVQTILLPSSFSRLCTLVTKILDNVGAHELERCRTASNVSHIWVFYYRTKNTRRAIRVTAMKRALIQLPWFAIRNSSFAEDYNIKCHWTTGSAAAPMRICLIIHCQSSVQMHFRARPDGRRNFQQASSTHD